MSYVFTTEEQYRHISNNWVKYCDRLLYGGGKKRETLTREIILGLLEKQEYKCALSGEPLTCTLEKGKRFWTNASIDQIVPGAGYTIDNIQIVQKRFNMAKGEMPLDEYIESCRKVVDFFDRRLKNG